MHAQISMDNTTSNVTAYWIAGIIVVLAIILGAWLLAGTGGVGVPNTGAQDSSVQTGSDTGSDSGLGY
jgi:hypothetical protein